MSEDYARKVREWLGDLNDDDEPVQLLVRSICEAIKEQAAEIAELRSQLRDDEYSTLHNAYVELEERFRNELNATPPITNGTT